MRPSRFAVNNHQEEKTINKNDYVIRLERKEEYREAEALVREAFWNVYRSGCLKHYVLNRLRNDEAFVPELDFVMEQAGHLIGLNVFLTIPPLTEWDSDVIKAQSISVCSV